MPDRKIEIEVWLAEREYPTVRMRVDGIDLTLLRVGESARDSGYGGKGEWVIEQIALPSGGGLLPSRSRIPCNHVTVLRAAEASYQDAPEGATQLSHSPKRNPLEAS